MKFILYVVDVAQIILIVKLICKHFVVILVLFICYVINVTQIMLINTRKSYWKTLLLDNPKPTN